MSAAIEIYKFSVTVIMCISGITLSSSVIIVYLLEWHKKQHFSVSDQIFLSMAFTNVFLQCVMLTNGVIYCFWVQLLFLHKGYLYMFIFQLFLIYGNFWHTAWLSVHYCLKLVNGSHDFFLQLKKRLSSFIINLLLITLVGLVINNLPFIWTLDIENHQNGTNYPSMKDFSFHMNYSFIICNMVIGSCVPFLITCICIGCSVCSLMGHVWKMKQKASLNDSPPNLNVHIRASKTMVAQVLLNSVMYFSLIAMWLSIINPEIIAEAILWTITMSYPSAQTVTLILGNPKIYRKLLDQFIFS